MKIITTANRKGGCCKSTTLTSIGQCLHSQGYRVLYVDGDPQCNSTMLLDADSGKGSVMDLLKGAELAECVTETRHGAVLRGTPHLDTYSGTDYFALHDLLEGAPYDFVLIDTPPALNPFTVSAIVASDALIVPVVPDAMSISGVRQFLASVRTIERETGKKILIAGILVCRYVPRLRLARQSLPVFQKTAQKYGTNTFTCPVRESVAMREAQALRKSIFEYAKTKATASDYRAVTAELIERLVQHYGKL